MRRSLLVVAIAVLPAAPAAAEVRYQLNMFVTPSGTNVSAARNDCSSNACSILPTGVAVRRGETTIAESPDGRTSTSLRPGDSVVLRSGGTDLASHTWQGRPAFESGITLGATSAGGLLTPGAQVSDARGGPPNVAYSTATIEDERFRFDYPQPLGCGHLVSIATLLYANAFDGGLLSVTEGRTEALPACAPPPPPGAVVIRDGDVLTVTGPQDVFRATVQISRSQMRFARGPATGAGCAGSPAVCALTGIRRVLFRFGPSRDELRVVADGSPPLDVDTGRNEDFVSLQPGPAGSRVNVGDGDDTVSARDGRRQTFVCGEGKDFVRMDTVDTLDEGCAPRLTSSPRVLGSYDANARGARVDLGRIAAPASVRYTVVFGRAAQGLSKEGTIRVTRAGRVRGRIGFPPAVTHDLRSRSRQTVTFHLIVTSPATRDRAAIRIRGVLRRR